MTTKSNDKILCIDDEINILNMFMRTLGRKHALLTADSGNAALEILHEQPDITVIVVDYNMPGLNGIEFLKLAHQISPDSVQIMLTGNIELDVSIKAINETHIFRYLPKPCPMEILNKVVEDALEQYHLTLEKRQLSLELEQKNLELASINTELGKQKYLLEQELEMARIVYARVVSHDQDKLDGLDYLVSSKESVGGDFLLTHTGPDKKTFYLMMGDLTGHGLQSALAVLLVAEGFRQYCLQQPSIDQLAARINDKMCRKLPTGLFCTALLVKLDLNKQELSLWQGGMPDAYFIDTAGQVTASIPSNNLPLGILAHQDFSSSICKHDITGSDALICCSDGVSEQLNDEQVQFGSDRLKTALSDTPPNSRRIDFIMQRLREHQGQQPQSDDISLLEINLPHICRALEQT